MKKIMKIFIISSIFLIVTIININVCFATQQQVLVSDRGGSSGSKVIDPDTYNPSLDPITEEDAEGAMQIIGVVLGAIRNISVVVAVITLMIIGFKYILGSVEEKANYKATMMPYIIGCILAVSGTTLVSFIYNSVN